MRLTDINNSQHSNVNNVDFLRSQRVRNTDLQATENKSALDKVEYSQSTQSSFNLNIASSMSQVSNIQTMKNVVSTALKIVTNFEKTVSENKNSLDNIQPEIQNFISTFNSSVKGLSSSINKITEEVQNEDSRVYFDGILGAKPISGQEIFEAISKQKQNLEQFNQALNHQLDQAVNEAKEMFKSEQSATPAREVVTQSFDFEFESKTFEAETVQKQSGSITQTQANAQPQTSTNLLVAS